MPEALIDLNTYNNLKELMGDDYIGVLVEAFFEETPRLLEDLRQALKERNAEAFRRTAHSIKSSGLNFGASSFAALAKELELMGKAADFNSAQEKVERLAADYAAVESELKALQDEP